MNFSSKKKTFFSKTALLFFAVIVFSACSLKYGMTVYDENSSPEFVFNDVNFDRYEDNKKTLSLSAERLEQYKDGKSIFAKNPAFKTYDDDGELATEGKCELLSADTNEEKYVLYDNIEINNLSDDIIVSADNLRWNGKTEQLVSGRTDNVSIKRGKTIMSGSGFSASGVSKQFSFTGVVTGETETGDGEDHEETMSDSSSALDNNEANELEKSDDRNSANNENAAKEVQVTVELESE